MVNVYIFAALFLSVHLLSLVSVQGGNVSDNSEKESKEVSHSHTTSLDYENTESFGFGNKSHYDRECYCGLGSRGCRYEYNEKVCDCKERYSQNGDACEQCYCGLGSRGCRYVNNKKVCACNKQYSQNGDTCEQCDCGFGSQGCRFVNNEIVCDCVEQYSQNGDTCERCYCGRFSFNCNFENGKKICSCHKPTKQNYKDECAACVCGDDAISCDFKGYSKVCTCPAGFIVENDKCQRCDCGLMALSCQLTFDKFTRCTCKSGYIVEKYEDTRESNEYCKLPAGPSGWKIATYIESVLFSLIILVCIVNLCWRKYSSK